MIWNIKRQNVQVYFSEVASSVHGAPAMFTAKPPGKGQNRRLCLNAPTICFDRAIVGAVEPEMQETGPTAQSLHPRLIVSRFWCRA